jgi:hypothetical protein
VNTQVLGGFGQVQFAEEAVGQGRVVMLVGMDHHLGQVRRARSRD